MIKTFIAAYATCMQYSQKFPTSASRLHELIVGTENHAPSPGAPSRLWDGERLFARCIVFVNGDGAAVHHIAIPDADVRRSAAVVAVSGEGDAAGICCCGTSNDTAGVGTGLFVVAHGSGIRVVADCEVDVAVAVLISHEPGNAADVTLTSTSRSGDGALVGTTRDGAVVCYIRDNAA